MKWKTVGYFTLITNKNMGRGPVVQARKDAVNAVKGKIFSLHAKLIAIACAKGGDPEKNPSLAAAIYTAKKAGVPNDNIDRAIKKGTGEDKDALQISEIVYEGYAPGGVALMVSTLTDNKNRTVSNIRHIFSKYGGNLGESGAVSWMFHKKGVIFIDPQKYNYDDIEEKLYELEGLEDVIVEKDYIKIILDVENFHESQKSLENMGIESLESKIDFIPENDTQLTEFDHVLKFKKMIQAFHEDEDVNIVSSNEVISADLEAEVEDFIQKNTFRT
ncbi:YebC/PmpR family DNA-binding transcriptional regulator [Candidatus Gracilibacteria bacterium]|nr:YebC/PmpR family DNA-binding transcriptional regulator [Candidatus Gracilibacteria bacterium]